jgi:TatD DNase family protein
MFIDVHCHLDLFKDIGKIVRNAEEKRVGIMINCGGREKSNRQALEISKEFENVKVMMGLYPFYTKILSEKKVGEEIEFIKQNKDKIVGIGEVGMDFKEGTVGADKQREVFKKMIELAIELDKPILVHSRKAERESVEILEKMKAKKVIMHCFSGKFTLAKRIAENGWFLSIPASIVYTESFKKIARDISLSNLLCETDSPYLHPVKGERNNEPANVVESYKKIAEAKGISLKEVEAQIEDNYNKLFVT